MRRRQRLEGRGRQPRSTCSPGSWRRQDAFSPRASSAAHTLIPDSALPNREGSFLGFEASKFATICYSSPGEKRTNSSCSCCCYSREFSGGIYGGPGVKNLPAKGTWV